MLGQNTNTTVAYNYTINPFHCDEPLVSVVVGANYTTVTLVYYNEVNQDWTFGVPSPLPVGRTSFTYATWNPALANQPLPWNPAHLNSSGQLDYAQQPTLNTAFTTAPSGLTPLSADTQLYRGICDVATSGGSFPSSANVEALTVAVSGAGLTASQYTGSFTGTTPQATGCKCIAFAVDSGNAIYPLADQYASNTPSSYKCLSTPPAGFADNADSMRLYWTGDLGTYTVRPQATAFNSTYLTNGWGTRQTTCYPGSSLYGSQGCETVQGTYRWKPVQNTQTSSSCGLRTEAKYVTQTSTLANLPFTTTNADTGVTTFSLFSVEVGSTANATANSASPYVDSFQTRVLEHKFQITTNKYGAVVVPIEAGDVLPPVLSRLVSSVITRDAAVPYQADVQFVLTMYVRQPNTITAANAATLPTSGQLLLETPAQAASAFSFQPVATVSGVAATCGTLAAVAAPYTATTGNAFGCQLGGAFGGQACGMVTQQQLPSYITANFNPNVINQPYYWVPYTMTLNCNFTLASSLSATSDLVVPSTTITINYGIMGNNTAVTDQRAPPFVSFNTYFTLQGQAVQTTAFPLTGRVVQIPESTTAGDATLSNMIYDSEALDVNTNQSIAYSEALAFKVQLTDPATRNQWQVIPALTMIAAFSGSVSGTGAPVVNPSPISSTYTGFSVSSPLDTGFCGLNRSDLVAAFVFDNVLSLSVNGLTPLNVGANNVINSLGLFGDLQNALTPSLQAKLAALVNANSFNNINLFQGNIFPAAAPVANQAQVFNVPDITGGFAVPMRNRLTINGQIGTYQIKFCALTEVAPYNASTRNGWYPLYPTPAAALADTASVGGAALLPPLEIWGQAFVGSAYSNVTTPAAAVIYYMPANPYSTGGKMCVPTAQSTNGATGVGATLPNARVAGVASVITAGSVALSDGSSPDAQCTAWIAGTAGVNGNAGLFAGRRRLASSSRKVLQAVSTTVHQGVTQQQQTSGSTEPPNVMFATQQNAPAQARSGSLTAAGSNSYPTNCSNAAFGRTTNWTWTSGTGSYVCDCNYAAIFGAAGATNASIAQNLTASNCLTTCSSGTTSYLTAANLATAGITGSTFQCPQAPANPFLQAAPVHAPKKMPIWVWLIFAVGAISLVLIGLQLCASQGCFSSMKMGAKTGNKMMGGAKRGGRW